MTERFLVDTSVWIEALRPGGKPEVAAWLRGALLQESVALAPPIKAEILLGARDKRQFDTLAEMLGVLPLLGDEREVWEQTASLGFRLRRQGLVVPLVDTLVASWALCSGCTLAHRDRHFDLIAEKVPELKTLSFIQ